MSESEEPRVSVPSLGDGGAPDLLAALQGAVAAARGERSTPRRCQYVTGWSRYAGRVDPHRRGAERQDGRIDVLCGMHADFVVLAGEPVPACGRCLPYVVRRALGGNVTHVEVTLA